MAEFVQFLKTTSYHRHFPLATGICCPLKVRVSKRWKSELQRKAALGGMVEGKIQIRKDRSQPGEGPGKKRKWLSVLWQPVP